MNRRRLLAAIAAACLGGCAILLTAQPSDAGAGDATLSSAPRPDWVRVDRLDVPTAPPLALLSSGTAFLLYDRQVDARDPDGRGIVAYTRVARMVADQVGLGAATQIEIGYDPAYQTVAIHGLRVWRGGEAEDRLPSAEVHPVDVGADEAGRFVGTRSFVVIVPDVRVGDTVEYEYSVTGANPVFGGRVSDAVAAEWDVPLAKFGYSILVDSDRPLRHRTTGGLQHPRVVEVGGALEYTWSRTNVPARLPDDRLPEWYQPYATIELSDYRSWEEVGAWAAALFNLGGSEPELDRVAGGIREQHTTALARTRAALRFVQDEIRYVAIEIGAGSHRPSRPADVLARRFGDCKDKSLLLAGLLERLAVPARVALVNTKRRGRVSEMLPSPLAFDHAVVSVEGEGGRTLWLDPSLSYQRGAALGAYDRPVGGALVLRGKAGAMVSTVGRRGPGIDKWVDVTMDLASDRDAAAMSVATRHGALAAERTRAELRAGSIAAAERAYRDFYSTLYPGLASREPLRIRDDEQSGEIEIRESYAIDSFWQFDDATARYVGELYPLELAESLEPPTNRVRTMPLALPHPTRVVYTIRANIDLGWQVHPSSESVESNALRFKRDVAADGDLLTVRYEYETLSDHVPADRVGAYLADLERIRSLLGYYVARPMEPALAASVGAPSALNWPKVFGGLMLVVLGFSAVSVLLTRKVAHAAPSPAASAEQALSFGLYAALAVLVVCAGAVAHDLRANVVPFLDTEAWVRLTAPDSADYHPFWAPYLVYAAVSRSALLGALAMLGVLFVRRHRVVPPLLVALAFLVGAIAYVELDCVRFVGSMTVAEAGVRASARAEWNFLGALASVVIGVPWLVGARSVRETFTA